MYYLHTDLPTYLDHWCVHYARVTNIKTGNFINPIEVECLIIVMLKNVLSEETGMTCERQGI